MSAVEEVCRAFGFCGEHIEMCRIDVTDMTTTLSISVYFADTFAGIVERCGHCPPTQPSSRPRARRVPTATSTCTEMPGTCLT